MRGSHSAVKSTWGLLINPTHPGLVCRRRLHWFRLMIPVTDCNHELKFALTERLGVDLRFNTVQVCSTDMKGIGPGFGSRSSSKDPNVRRRVNSINLWLRPSGDIYSIPYSSSDDASMHAPNHYVGDLTIKKSSAWCISEWVALVQRVASDKCRSCDSSFRYEGTIFKLAAPYLLPATNTLMTCSVYATVAVAINRFVEMSPTISFVSSQLFALTQLCKQPSYFPIYLIPLCLSPFLGSFRNLETDIDVVKKSSLLSFLLGAHTVNVMTQTNVFQEGTKTSSFLELDKQVGWMKCVSTALSKAPSSVWTR